MDFELVERKNERKEASHNPIVQLNPTTVPTKYDSGSSLSEFQEWILDNQSVSLEQIRASLMQKTFRDENGILRYTSNWLPATDVLDSSSGGPQKHFFETGCWELQFVLPILTGTDLQKSTESESRKVITIKLLRDWERLWRHLASDKSDEFTEHAGLLRACIGFFMHEKTVALFWFLFIYCEILGIWLYSSVLLLSNLAATGSIGTTYLILLGIIYSNLRRLYVSKVNKQMSDEDDLRGKYTPKSPIKASETLKFAYQMHWQGALRRYVVVMLSELKAFFYCIPRAGDGSRTTRKGGKHVQREVVSSFEDLLNIALKYVLRHCELSPNEIDLNRGGYKFAFLSLITILPLYCLVEVALEWKVTFDVCASFGSSSDECRNYIIYMALNFGFVTHGVYHYLIYGALVVGLIGLRYGTELAYYMVDCWMRRYAGLRKIRLSSTENELKGMNRTENRTLGMADEGKDLDLAKSLQMDAIEQYLFMVEYMRQSGAIWSPVVVGMYVYALLQAVAVSYYLYSYSILSSQFAPSSLALLSPMAFELCLFLIFPTFSIAKVNSLLAPMMEMFTKSSKDDFEMIGNGNTLK